jgi:hypothetical protein
VTKVRTISLSKVAKIAEEQEVIRAPLVEGDGEMTPAGRFQVSFTSFSTKILLVNFRS